MKFENYREIWEIFTHDRDFANPANYISCSLILAIGIAGLVAMIFVGYYGHCRFKVLHAGLKSDAAFLGLRWIVILLVSLIFIVTVITTSTVERKKQYAFMAFFLASMFAVLLFIPFMSQGAKWNTPIGIYMLGCAVVMVLCGAGWSITFSVYKTIISKTFDLIKSIKILTK